MKKILIITFCAALLVACQAPQGKKYSDTKRELPAIASPPSLENAVVYEIEKGTIVAVKPGGTLTVFLSANAKSDFRWRLAEIPDPTVLRLVSHEFVPQVGSNRGEEKWVFHAVGAGEIDLRLWYTGQQRQRFGSAPVFRCIVAVEEDLAPVAQGPDGKRMVKPKVHRTTPRVRQSTPPKPDVESEPFNEPVFRSSGVPLRDQRDGQQQQS